MEWRGPGEEWCVSALLANFVKHFLLSSVSISSPSLMVAWIKLHDKITTKLTVAWFTFTRGVCLNIVRDLNERGRHCRFLSWLLISNIFKLPTYFIGKDDKTCNIYFSIENIFRLQLLCILHMCSEIPLLTLSLSPHSKHEPSQVPSYYHLVLILNIQPQPSQL